MLRSDRGIFKALLFVALCCGAATAARADTFTLTVPNFNGPFSLGPFPGAAQTVGAFGFALPAGQQVVAATLSGTFGTTGTTAPLNLLLDGLQVAQCPPGAPCTGAFGSPGPTAFVYNFTASNLTLLNDGLAQLAFSQLGPGAVRLGGLTLTVQTAAPVPEPATLLLLGAGLAGVASRMRRHRRRARAAGEENPAAR